MYNGSINIKDIDASRYPELRKWVVSSLAGHKKPNDIIFQICHRTGWDWNLSKRFVEQVIDLDQKEVHQRRMPLLVALGILFLSIGAFSFYSACMDLLPILAALEPPLDAEKVVNAVLMANTARILIIKLVFGLAGVVGGGVGIASAVKSAATGEGEDLMKSGTQK
ncbi:MAG: hypothetical protein JW929_15380 [Anaerolineales bacterium]|nr:hypothetical protein [Anaerolineales bacterium]